MLLRSKIFSENLLRIRQSKGMKQVEVIAKLQILGSDLSISAYSKIENNARNIKISDLVGLKMVFDVDYSEFFVGIEPNQGDE